MEENNIRNNVYKKAGIIGAGKAGCSLGMFIKNKCGDVELPDKKCWGSLVIIVYIKLAQKKLQKEPEAYVTLP